MVSLRASPALMSCLSRITVSSCGSTSLRSAESRFLRKSFCSEARSPLSVAGGSEPISADRLSDTGVISKKQGFIIDMDGVVYHGSKLLLGAIEFVDWLKQEQKDFLFLTNSSERTQRELQEKLRRLGLDVERERFYSSAEATASFLRSQMNGFDAFALAEKDKDGDREGHGGSCYIIGESGLAHALYMAGFSMNDVNPDYVVVGETRSYDYEKLERAARLVRNGSRLIGTNIDIVDPSERGIIPAAGALIAPIELMTGAKAYYVGKPNPLIMRQAMEKIGCRREETVVIGDRMDTDMRAGIEAGLSTVLLMSGVTHLEDVHHFGFRPHFIARGLHQLVEDFRRFEDRLPLDSQKMCE